jgi:hypothetical protein
MPLDIAVRGNAEGEMAEIHAVEDCLIGGDFGIADASAGSIVFERDRAQRGHYCRFVSLRIQSPSMSVVTWPPMSVRENSHSWKESSALLVVAIRPLKP